MGFFVVFFPTNDTKVVDIIQPSCYDIPTMKITIEFDTDNAAFEDNFLMAVTKALAEAKETILDSENTTELRRMIKDINGNRIGTTSVSHWKINN